MTIFNCTFVSVEARNVHAFLSECIFSITNCTNGLLFSGYATASNGDRIVARFAKAEPSDDKAYHLNIPLF